ncbi:MAG: hypothetical protein ACOX8N_00025 [Christensenellales bacterium]
MMPFIFHTGHESAGSSLKRAAQHCCGKGVVQADFQLKAQLIGRFFVDKCEQPAARFLVGFTLPSLLLRCFDKVKQRKNAFGLGLVDAIERENFTFLAPHLIFAVNQSNAQHPYDELDLFVMPFDKKIYFKQQYCQHQKYDGRCDQ